MRADEAEKSRPPPLPTHSLLLGAIIQRKEKGKKEKGKKGKGKISTANRGLEAAPTVGQ